MVFLYKFMIFVWLSHALLVYTQADLYPILSLLMRSRHQSLGFTILLGCQSLGLLGLVLGMSASRSLSFKSLPGQCLGFIAHIVLECAGKIVLEVKTQICLV